MDPLRLIILLFGLVVIVGIYLRYRQPGSTSTDKPAVDRPSLLQTLKALLPRKAEHLPEEEHRLGPKISLDDVDAIGAIKVHGSDLSEAELSESVSIGWDSMTPVAPQDELLIVFNILARPGQVYSGSQIRAAAEQAGFQFGDMQIFHYRAESLSRGAPAVCSFANLLQPGHFEQIDSAGFTTPGISLFARLPGPLEARDTFNLTLDRAYALASSLGAILCDESRSILSEQTIGHIKEKVEAFRFKQKMAAMKRRQQR